MATAMVVSTATFAASDGQMGPTSTGSTDIMIEKPAAVQISNVDNLDFESHPFIPGGGFLEVFDPVCVFSSTGLFQLLVENPANSTNLELIGDNTGVVLPFELLWEAGNGDYETDVPDVFFGQVGDAVSPDCFGSTNATLGARIQGANYDLVPADTYTGTVLLTVSPE